jgi:hypothetical protein
MSDATSKLPTTTLNHSPAAVRRGLDPMIASPDRWTGRAASGGGAVCGGVRSGAGDLESDGAPNDRNDSGSGFGQGAGGASGRPGFSIAGADVVNGWVDMASSVRVAPPIELAPSDPWRVPGRSDKIASRAVKSSSGPDEGQL